MKFMILTELKKGLNNAAIKI